MKFKKQALSLLTIAAFFLIAIASKVNKIQGNAFSGEAKPEDKAETNYVVLNDGSHVTGHKIAWKTGTLVKDQIRIDDQKFKLAEVQGYMENGTYWKKSGNNFMVRLVHGKLNVYRDSYQSTVTSSSPTNGRMTTHTVTHYSHYLERGENGPMSTLANQKDIKEAVGDCPLAVELASLSDKKMRKAIRANKRYLNEIFEVYNNDCKAVR
ncbi:MAG: hypothetical protein ABIN93_12580 [Ginsengibacter sp.]